MPSAYSVDLRIRVVEYFESHQPISMSELGRVFGISDKTAKSYVALWESGQDLHHRVASGARPKLQARHLKWLRQHLEKYAASSSYEVTGAYNKRFPKTKVHRSTILRAMHRLGFSVKKKQQSRPSSNAPK